MMDFDILLNENKCTYPQLPQAQATEIRPLAREYTTVVR